MTIKLVFYVLQSPLYYGVNTVPPLHWTPRDFAEPFMNWPPQKPVSMKSRHRSQQPPEVLPYLQHVPTVSSPRVYTQSWPYSTPRRRRSTQKERESIAAKVWMMENAYTCGKLKERQRAEGRGDDVTHDGAKKK